MTDRELLELAAKAAGIEYEFSRGSIGSGWILGRFQTLENKFGQFEQSEDFSTIWKPLADDGDALRLAVRLHMGVQANGPDHWQSPSCTIVLFESDCPQRLTESHDGDDATATRRAIVRAAAEIGKNLQEQSQ